MITCVSMCVCECARACDRFLSMYAQVFSMYAMRCRVLVVRACVYVCRCKCVVYLWREVPGFKLSAYAPISDLDLACLNHVQ